MAKNTSLTKVNKEKIRNNIQKINKKAIRRDKSIFFRFSKNRATITKQTNKALAVQEQIEK